MPRLFLLLLLLPVSSYAQNFYFGADQSYVNEMEDCGTVFQEADQPKDVYDIFADHGSNLVRLRLWHTPSWYDTLNTGVRYSDLADVKKSIARAKAHDMTVLLDFHLSDTWADPAHQLVPAAWLSVVDELSVLQDSVYRYIYATLNELAQENLLPEMVQIGNETNRGILLSAEDNETWMLNWERNSALFNTAIEAVRAIEQVHAATIRIALHLAGPTNAPWLVDGFISHGVTDFDIIGMSYYWAWHMPTTIAQTGDIIETFRSQYPDKEVMILETGYLWTTAWNDNASNIITAVHPDYSPASPENQRDWLIDLTKEVMASGGSGVIYWEPSWVSTDCYTPWGQGSHQEHATFFDFSNQLLLPGGIQWMEYDYSTVTATTEELSTPPVRILTYSFNGAIKILLAEQAGSSYHYQIADTTGRILQTDRIRQPVTELSLANVPHGVYVISVSGPKRVRYSQQFIYSGE